MSNTGNNVALIEANVPMNRIGPIVHALGLNEKRFLFTALEAFERNPRLLDFPMQTAVRAIATGGMLGLECNPITGHGYLVPYGGKNPTIQFIPGYKGMVSSALRAGISISSGVLKDGDEWPSLIRAGEAFAVKQKFGNRAQSNLMGSWAQAKTGAGWGLPIVLDMSEILAIKAKSAGGKMKDSPWMDAGVGFEAMAQKCPIRRLQRFTGIYSTPEKTWGAPEAFRAALAVDQLHEDQGHSAQVHIDGHIVDDGKIFTTPPVAEIKPELQVGSGKPASFGAFAHHENFIKKINMTENIGTLKEIAASNKSAFADWRMSENSDATTAADAIEMALESRIKELEA